jgi:hypothetical protein
MKTITWEEIEIEKKRKLEELKSIPLEERLPSLIKKMMGIVRGDTGGSEVYADMLLSMLPGTDHKVDIGRWCYKSDSDDFQTMLELMMNYNNDLIWKYEKLVFPYRDELLSYLGVENKKDTL